jgi:hypothetical protein
MLAEPGHPEDNLDVRLEWRNEEIGGRPVASKSEISSCEVGDIRMNESFEIHRYSGSFKRY